MGLTVDELAQPVEAGPQATAVLLKTNNLGIEFKNLEKDISCGNFPLGQWVKLKLLQSAIELQDIFKTISEEEVAPLLAQTRLSIKYYQTQMYPLRIQRLMKKAFRDKRFMA